jgi:hypothetical protein
LVAVIGELDAVRTMDRTAASDEQRLTWIDLIREVERRATALSALLVTEADRADSAQRARHTPMSNWLARSGQQTSRQAAGALWAGRALDRRPRVFDAATAGQISMGQAKAIGTDRPRSSVG